jgi:hypothetical protein
MHHTIEPGSFRDPSGFLFFRNGRLLRQINRSYAADFDHLMASGLYRSLVDQRLLVSHEVDSSPAEEREGDPYLIIAPQPLPFISYPYEWCFSQLRDAALATLRIEKLALDHGMTLKDSSAYNIQFFRGAPILIDTLSFEKYVEGQPWVAYRQFCQHFLAPLALMARTDVRLSQLLRVHLDGVPLDLASALLPLRSWLSPTFLLHIHLHARSQRYFSTRGHADARRPTSPSRGRTFSRRALLGLVDSLASAVTRLRWKSSSSEWADYYQTSNYDDAAHAQKRKLVSEYLDVIQPGVVWDLGANNGLFSRIASEKGIPTYAFDMDPACVEWNYRHCHQDRDTNILPLLLDLTNPSPAIGWANQERKSLGARSHGDTVMALALIHHLAISNNVPLPRIAEFFHTLCRDLVIEFVPKGDSQGTERVLYHMKAR